MKNNSKKIIMGVLGILSLILITFGVTYAVFNYTKLGTTENTITSGTLKFLYTENTGVGNGISITNALPVSDEIGKNYSTEGYVFDFKIEGTNSGTEAINYEVTLRKKSTSTLIDNAVKVYLTDMTNNTDTSIVAPTLYSNLTNTTIDVGNNVEKTLYNGTVPGGELTYLKNFRLRMWIDEAADFSSGDLNDKSFTATINVYANANVVSEPSIYKETILNGTDPVLKDNLIPIKIADDGTVTKVDINTEWYNYENKIWANAIILKDETKSYDNNEVIPEDDIESYFVWIPKYSYQLWDLGEYDALTSNDDTKVHTIPIKFGTTDTVDSKDGECTTPGTSGQSGNCVVGDYMTHPAFQAFDTTGLWVGKFETGYDGASSTGAAEVNSNDSSKIIIKPNVYSWRSITIGNMFKASYDYQRDLESHMMKNTEWGAVAYLSHSSYGSSTSVRNNNNSAFITGYASTVEPILGHNNGVSIEGNRNQSTKLGVDGTYTVNYLNSDSKVASTTGNISGIYDMAGGAWAYVMAYTTGAGSGKDLSKITSLYNDFFTNNDWNKYYDKYNLTLATQYNNRILGDATSELGPFQNKKNPTGDNYPQSSWYNDYGKMIYSTYPWNRRSGYYGDGVRAGLFAYMSFTGGSFDRVSFRIVLTP